MKNKFKISLMAILLVCFVASAGWGVHTWKGMYLENCTIQGTLTNEGAISGASALVFEGATADAYETTLAITDPTADKTITFPDHTGSLCLVGGGPELADGIWGTAAGDLVFEGNTANDHETTLDLTDPTADRTITVPNASGAIMVSTLVTNAPEVANSVTGGTGTLIFEGSGVDDHEMTVAVTNPTADRTITLPDSSISAAEFGTLTGILATTDELNRAADVSTRIVTLVETGAITLATHEGKICLLGEVGGDAKVTLTLPEATGSGAVYRFVVSVVNTSQYCFQTVDAANCSFYGSANLLDADAAAQTAYTPAATDDLITLNGTTTGGQLGDFVELIDFDTDKWGVVGQLVCPAGSNVATPFSGA